MTKLSYNLKTNEYIISELGRIVDSDPNLEVIAHKHGFFSVNDEQPEEASTEGETGEAE